MENNQQLRDLIPDHFSDIDYLFEEVLFSGLIFFWEKDGGEASLEYNSRPWPECPDLQTFEHKEVYDYMKEAYSFAKKRAQLLEEESLTIEDEEYNYELDRHLENILKYRKYLQT